MRVLAGRIDALPRDRCVAVGDGRCIVVRTADGVVAFPNRCLHQDSPLDGGWVRDGVLSCPLHFWRYRLDDGSLIGGVADDRLDPLPVEIVGDEVFVDLSTLNEPVTVSLRQQLLDRAAEYDRSTAHAAHLAGRGTPRPAPLIDHRHHHDDGEAAP